MVLDVREFTSCVAGALERMAFVAVEPDGSGAGALPGERPFCARVAIDGGEAPGWLAVAVTGGLVEEAAGGLLGVDPDAIEAEAHGEAVAAELANVFGGELLVRSGGADRPLRLGVPAGIAPEDVAALLSAAPSVRLGNERGGLVVGWSLA